jgi:predicted GIY-YIG superfamily endonuclease
MSDHAEHFRARRPGTFKARCEEAGVNYWRALKRRKAGMSEDKIFAEGHLRSEREVNTITIYGRTYPNLLAAYRVLEPTASAMTIARWLAQGLSPEFAFERVPNPGYAAGIVYLVTHRDTGLAYVGLTVQTLSRRWEFHRQQAGSGFIKGEQSLHAAIRKFGIEAFDICQIDTGVSKKNLEQKERHWIRKLHTLSPNGYNIHTGGVSGGSNKVPVEVDEISFPGKREAAEHIAKTRGISFQAAKKRLTRGRVDVRTPARPGESVVKTKAYKAWSHIIHGVLSPKAKDHIPGVALHDPWREFDKFLTDFCQPPNKEMSFIRFDKARGYVPGNCGWVARSEAASAAARHGETRKKAQNT